MKAITSRFACNTCGKTYLWKPHLAHRQVKCKCGRIMIVPDAPAAPNEDAALYDVVEDQTAKSTPVSSSPVIPIARPVNYARAQTIGESTIDSYFPDRVKDLYAPLAMIAVGTVIELTMAMAGRSRSLAYAMTSVGVFMVANTILMLLVVTVVAKVRDISFGPVPTAIIKLCGLSIGPGAVGSLLSWMFAWFPFLGSLGGWLIGCILYFALFGAMFDLDESDTWVVVLSVFFVRLAAIVGLLLILR